MDNFFIDGNQLFCNVNKDCVYDNEKCKSIDKENNDDSKVRDILRNFTLDYNVSIEEIKQKINKNYDIAVKRIKKIISRNNNLLLKNDYISQDNVQEQDIVISPYEHLKNLIIGDKNIVNKYSNIRQFAVLFARESINRI